MASSPTDGARVASAPATVTLTFDESVRLVPAAAQVISTTGERADEGTAHLSADATTIVIPLRPELPRGGYAATWRVISADGHIVSGSVSFGVGQDAGAMPPAPPNRSGQLTLASDLARGVLYVGLVLAVGVSLVCRVLWPWALALARMRMLIAGGWASIAVATIAHFLLQGPQSLNASWSAVLTGDALSDTLFSRTGAILVLRAMLIAALGVALRLQRRGSTSVLAVCSVGVALTVAVEGHAGVGDQAWLATVITALHLLAMTLWLGGLVTLCLAVLPARRVDNLHRWSLIAFGCVSVLILSGEYQAWRQVRPVEAMWSTGYGITLSVKLAIVALMLALARLGQRRLDPRTLRRTVPAEIALGLAVVAVTTALVSQPPARATYGPPVTLSAPLDRRSAQVRLDTTRRGPTTISVKVLDAAGHPIRATSVSGTLSSEDARIAALNVKFERSADDEWHSSNAVVPLPGSWTLKLVVEFSTSDAIATAAHFRVW
ncbi:copper resistance CopC/CopD family protein [Mycobacterium sp. AT1]|uniref:copper resistance CopC/CopD family protein n=1 Tax=Mycobacterium sp. AT1 TaxID=1961706 RepID=UPI001154D1E2|nr:copper resistance protein CopC [Mycobacterium sp. AT1]